MLHRGALSMITGCGVGKIRPGSHMSFVGLPPQILKNYRYKDKYNPDRNLYYVSIIIMFIFPSHLKIYEDLNIFVCPSEDCGC